MKNCEICSTKLNNNVLDLGNHPLCNDLIPINNKKKNI